MNVGIAGEPRFISNNSTSNQMLDDTVHTERPKAMTLQSRIGRDEL
jgi:hypothetical protein